jgi:hypothetical protein
MLASAGVHGDALRFFRTRLTAADTGDIRTRVDSVINGLIWNYEQDEAPLKQEEAYLESFMVGDMDNNPASPIGPGRMPGFEPHVDFRTLLVDLAFSQHERLSVGARRLTVSWSAEWIIAADQRLADQSWQDTVTEALIRIEYWGVRTWTATLTEQSEDHALTADLARAVAAETRDRWVNRAFRRGAQFCGLLAAAAVLGLVAGIAGGGAVLGTVLFLVVAIPPGVWLARRLVHDQATIRTTGKLEGETAAATLQKALAQWRQVWVAWHERMADAERFCEYLRSLTAEYPPNVSSPQVSDRGSLPEWNLLPPS